MGFRDAYVGEEFGNGLAAHGGAAVAVEGELVDDALVEEGVRDEPLRDGTALVGGTGCVRWAKAIAVPMSASEEGASPGGCR